MLRNKGKPKRAMTEEERLHEALEMIVEGNAPFVHDIAGAAYNYALSQVKDMLKKEMEAPGAQASEILQKVDQLRYNDFIATRQ